MLCAFFESNNFNKKHVNSIKSSKLFQLNENNVQIHEISNEKIDMTPKHLAGDKKNYILI